MTNSPINAARRRLIGTAKQLAYSPTMRNIARKAITSQAAAPVRKVLEEKGLEGHLRRFTSESLPEGQYFAKLTIDDWQSFNGQSFRLYQESRIIYGNEIEPPAKGFPLEYRNIIVTSPKASDFTLDIDSPYTLQIGKGAFTTPQQVSYDKQYGVEQHGDIFYSVRGNTTAPKKLFITFPGFGPSTSRVSYAVSYLKGITELDLSDSLMICFQDRYLTAGSYMLIDNAGRSLVDRVNEVIRGFVDKYDIAESQMLFFGASKGGSIAVQYAEPYPGSRLLIAVPQMHLKYYLDKPFFKDNIYNETGMHSVPQPESLIRRYFDQGRNIDYFYTNSDEQSNFSLIEAVADVPGLTKYRVDGKHGEVAKKALPTMLGLMRQFLAGAATEQELTVEDVRAFDYHDSTGVQVRIDDESSPSSATNWYLQSTLGRTQFLLLISDHELPFVKYTNPNQHILSALDNVTSEWMLVAREDDGTNWEGQLPEQSLIQTTLSPSQPRSVGKLRLDNSTPMEHFIVTDNHISNFVYSSRRGHGNTDAIDIHVVDDIRTIDLAEISMGTDSKFVAAVETAEIDERVDLMINRLSVISGCAARNVSDDRISHDEESRQHNSVVSNQGTAETHLLLTGG